MRVTKSGHPVENPDADLGFCFVAFRRYASLDLVTRCFCFGILSRRSALNLCCIYNILNKTEAPDISETAIRATMP